MKKLSVSFFVLAVIFIGIALSSTAAVVEKEDGYVSVSSSSTQEMSPTQVEISINIETSDKSLQKAANENKVIADKVYSSLKALLNTEKGDYLKTQGYSANPQYIYTQGNKKVFDKYVVSNNIVVRTKNITIAPKLIDTAIAQGATNVNNLQFMVAEYDCACNELLSNLTKKAYNQANTIALAAGARVVGIKSINSSCNSENGPRPMYKMMGASIDSASNTPIEGGKIKIYANIDASFYVK